MSSPRQIHRDRSRLQQVPLAALDGSGLLVTIAQDEPMDALHEAAIEAGGLLLEVDAYERPVAAYRGRGRLAEDLQAKKAS